MKRLEDILAEKYNYKNLTKEKSKFCQNLYYILSNASKYHVKNQIF